MIEGSFTLPQDCAPGLFRKLIIDGIDIANLIKRMHSANLLIDLNFDITNGKNRSSTEIQLISPPKLETSISDNIVII